MLSCRKFFEIQELIIEFPVFLLETFFDGAVKLYFGIQFVVVPSVVYPAQSMEPQGDFCILRRIVAEQGFHYREIRLLMVIPQGKALQNARVHILLGPDFGGMFLEPGCKVWNCPLSPAAQALFEELPVLFSYPEMVEQLPDFGVSSVERWWHSNTAANLRRACP